MAKVIVYLDGSEIKIFNGYYVINYLLDNKKEKYEEIDKNDDENSSKSSDEET